MLVQVYLSFFTLRLLIFQRRLIIKLLTALSDLWMIWVLLSNRFHLNNDILIDETWPLVGWHCAAGNEFKPIEGHPS